MTDMKFKKTGIPWSPEAPFNWDLKRGKFLFKSEKVINNKMQCKDRLALTLKGVIDRYEGDGVGLNPNDLRTYQIFNSNDLVFKLIDLENKKTSRVGYVHKRGIMSSAYIRVVGNHNVNMRYYYYQYFDLYQRYVFNMIGQGVRATMSSTDLLNITILIPPLETQNAIVDYLDRKTTQIQDVIRKKERLIGQIIERKHRTIETLTTKGVDNNIELTFSGDKLFGKVPAKWKVKRLRFVAKNVKTGTTPASKLKDYFENGDFNWFTPGDFNEDLLLLDSERKVNENAIKDKEISIFPSNSVLIIGIGGTVGKVGIIKNPASSNQQINSITFSKEIIPEYGLHILAFIGRNLLNILDYTTLPILNQSDTKNLNFLVPSKGEQSKIINDINIITQNSKLSIAKVRLEIEKIKEYQESLITNIVTGKLKVPELNK
jgi:type I restriction enzyme S subunit